MTETAKSAPRRRIMRPMQIVRVMNSPQTTEARRAAGRRILSFRYGFTNEQIDLMLSRGAAMGKAPIAASRFALNVMSQQLPALRTAAPPKMDALDWFLHGGRKIF